MKMLAKFRKSGSFKVLTEKDQLRLKGGKGSGGGSANAGGPYGGGEPPPPVDDGL